MKWFPFFLFLMGGACLFAPRAAALLPEGGGPYLDQQVEFQRDMAQVKHDPAADEAAAERRRQEVRDAMAKPPVDAPNYRLAMEEKRGILTAVAATNRGGAGVPVLSLGESEIPLLPAAFSRRGWPVFDVLVLGCLMVVLGVLFHKSWRPNHNP